MKIKTWDNKLIELDLPEKFKGRKLLVLPALIDPHVHFRTPGSEHKEDWTTGSSAALAGGVTNIIDMPNNNPACIDYKSLMAKKKIIESQIDKKIKYHLYLGATDNNLNEIEKCKDEIIGVKVFMGSSTGNLLVDKKEEQEKIFKKCAKLDLLVAVHAEDELTIQKNQLNLPNERPSDHSKIRSKKAAVKAITQALELAKKYGTKLYILHVSTKKELALIKNAKKEGVNVYVEVTPHHLFLNKYDYKTLGTKALVNPPLRTKEDNEALWKSIKSGLIDTIGTDHAPHLLKEKEKPYGIAPSGLPSIENYLSLLLNAYHKGKITLEKIVEFTYTNPQKIFRITKTNDLVIVDLEKEKVIKNENQKTKCLWSPYDGWKVKGIPIAIIQGNKLTILNNN